MDTRSKILSRTAAALLVDDALNSATPLRVVTGCFDPIYAPHARRLGEIARDGECLLAVLRNPPAPLLPARARSELVAALRVINYVVLPDTEEAGDALPDWLNRIPARFVTP